MLYNYIIISAGILASLILFFHFPTLKIRKTSDTQYKISVIIPARNEEGNIQLLLQDLMKQTANIHEIICVDDCSTDATHKVASSFNVKVISIKDKPSDWTGKAWACQKGAESATGEILLFLDADVRLCQNAVASLVSSYDENKCVISVQPYHRTVKYYEQFSFFFNIIQIAANGVGTAFLKENVGLFGPVILIDNNTYNAIDGHLSAQKSIVDDLALGEKLKKMGFHFKLFLGGNDISFRMYGDNLKSLFRGWTKNYATGALKTPFFIFALVFLWVTSCTLCVISLVESVVALDIFNILIIIAFYFLWALELFRISNKIGEFKTTTIIAFPIYLVFFIYVFLVSFLKKLFHMNVVWKDRKIKLIK